MKKISVLLIGCMLCAGCKAQPVSSKPSVEVSEVETPVVEVIEVDQKQFQKEIVGTYRLRSDDRLEYLKVSAYCGELLLERYDVKYDYYSLEEIYFEDSSVLSQDVNSAEGVSILYTDIIQRDTWAVTLEDNDRLKIRTRGFEWEYEKDDKIDSFDAKSPEDKEYTYSEDLVGNWMSMQDQFTFAYMELSEEGEFVYLLKKKDMPIKVFEGYWHDDHDAFIQVSGSYIGQERSERTLLIETGLQEGAVFLSTANEPDFLINEEMTFLKTDENCLMPDSLYKQDFVYTYVCEEGTYMDQSDIEIDYSFRMPQLLVNTPAGIEINQAIEKEYGSLIMDARNEVIAKEPLLTNEISYFTQDFGDVLVLVIRKTQYPFYDRYYNVYYYDRKKECSYTKEDILKQLNMSEEVFLEKAKEQARIQYELFTEDLKEEYPDMYEEGYKRIDDYIKLDMISFCPIEGGILLYCPVASLAQNPYYYHELFIQLD